MQAASKRVKFPKLILASASPRRAELLRRLGVAFQISPAGVREIEGKAFSAVETARINACKKARAAAGKHPGALVMGVDTVVALDDAIFGKPATLAEAERMLWKLRGKTHRVVTAVCLISTRDRLERVFSEETAVTFRPMTRAQIRRYHAQVNPLDKAGAYGIQEKAEMLVQSISGSLSNVVGLPLERLAEELPAFGARQHRAVKRNVRNQECLRGGKAASGGR